MVNLLEDEKLRAENVILREALSKIANYKLFFPLPISNFGFKNFAKETAVAALKKSF